MSGEGSSVAHLSRNHKTNIVYSLAIRFLRFFVIICNVGGCDVRKLLTAWLALFIFLRLILWYLDFVLYEER